MANHPERARRPLDAVRVLAVEQYGAGPFGSMHLADLGADVIKIEDPSTRGDVGRYVPPFQEGEDSLFFETFNRNKRSLSLDLTSDAGRQVFHDLVKKADAVYSNLRGDVPSRLGLTYADLAGFNPAIVCCALTGFGMAGPRAREAAYDYILQGISGWMSLTGEPDAPPTKSGLSLVDFCGGMVAALALVTGVLSAKETGVGMDCDLSLFDVAVSMLTYIATWQMNGPAYEPRRYRNSAHPSIVPFQNFRTSDGWIVVACAKEKFWERLAHALGRPDLLRDQRFATLSQRSDNRDTLLAELQPIFATGTSKEWLTTLAAAGVPCGPVNSVAEALADPQTAARALIVETDHPVFGAVKQLRSPVRVGALVRTYRRAPRRGEDAAEILTGLLGYPPERVQMLQDQGAFGH